MHHIRDSLPELKTKINKMLAEVLSLSVIDCDLTLSVIAG
jgi:hypothetical protein